MKHVFGFQRSLLKAVRPLANRIAPVELPPDSYFRNIQSLFEKIEGIDVVLQDAAMTSVRLVTNAEKMVLRETQRAFVYFSLNGLVVDGIIVNRLLPEEVRDAFFDGWRQAQQEMVAEIERYFAPVPVRKVPMFRDQVLGYERLRQLASVLYEAGEDPAAASRSALPFAFVREGDHYRVELDLPFTEKAEVGVFKKDDELVIQVGTVRRHVGLPTTMANLTPRKARLLGRKLVIELGEQQ
jgi:arsenite-transporting ATPase